LKKNFYHAEMQGIDLWESTESMAKASPPATRKDDKKKSGGKGENEGKQEQKEEARARSR
jgi:hypothetical protein